MIVESADQNYQIRELEQRKRQGIVTFSWKFREATDFLVFIYDSSLEFDLATAIEIIEEAGIEDQDIISSTKKVIPLKNDGTLKMLHIGRREFLKNNRCLQLPMNEFKKDIPYGTSVYACRYAENLKGFYVYKANLENNTCFLPILIDANIQYKERPLSKDKLCILKLPVIDKYRDGAIMYHVDGVELDFPLSQQCLGKELTIIIPKHSKVSIRIQEKYKKYYKDR